ncbi:MAG: hypothetical protein ACI9ES_003475 [Oceanospirillaceae bacterium]|jgi:hypothetical protein
MNFSSISTHFEQFSKRERGLIFISSFSLILALLFILVIEPQYLAWQDAKLKIKQTQTMTVRFQASTTALNQILSMDPVNALNEQHDALKIQRHTLQDELSEQGMSVSSAAQLDNFLEIILSPPMPLKIESLHIESLPFTTDDDLTEDENLALLRQNVILKLQLSNSAVTAFLQFIQAQDLSIAWDSLSYQQLREHQVALDIRLHLFSARQ